MLKRSVWLLLLLATTCSYVTAQECGIIYVAPNGASAGNTGTKANPASLLHGLSLSNPTNNILWLAAGTYTIDNEISIPNSVTIEGGFDPNSWIKSNTTPSIIQRSGANPLPPPANALVAIAGLAAQNFTLQDLTIEVADAPPSSITDPLGITVYGIYLNNCTNYSITRCSVITGNASDGQPGQNGTNGAPGGNGANGQNGDPDNQNFNPGSTFAAGGTSPCGCNGGNGGNGGWSGNSNGTNGQQGACGGGNGGNGGEDFCSANCSHPNNSNGSNGQNGAVGGNGADGGNGPAGTVVTGYWRPGAQAPTGATGDCGSGGGGGGGGGSESGLFCNDGSGADGGSGGGGGAGGTGGTGGYGGGSSFCIFVANNGASGVIQDCSLSPGNAGQGGLGGQGGQGGAGGLGGQGGGDNCDVGDGGDGGNGGAGGLGGNGGAGADGLSQAIFEAGGTPVVTTNITGVPGNPPVIIVENYGCTNSDILFSATVGGTWDFGTNANPQTANGAGPIAVTYPTTGSRSITFNGTVFTDFIGIYNDGPTLPSITPANPTVDAGCPNQFSTSLVGSQYDWDFGPVASPPAESGASVTTTSDVVFSTPGTYWIKVTVLTDCCGPVTDSTEVTVQLNAFDVNLTADNTAICEGDAITFTANPAAYDNYEFFIDGISVQNGSSNTYSSSTIQQGDSIYVEAFVGSCFANPSDTVVPTVNPIPTVTLTSDDVDNEICEGEPVTFTASPAGLDNYEFFNGTNSLQSGASEVLFGTVPANNSITVVATENGCSSDPSAAIVTQVNPLPQVVLTVSDLDSSICDGDDVTFTAIPPGLANYEFFEGVASAQNGPSNIYQTNALVDGTDVTVVATSAEGCVGPPTLPITMSVNPYPVITLGSSDPDNEICAGESITFTASPAGLDSYEFFDGGVSVQDSPAESYSTAGLITGNSITVEGTQFGCTSTASAPIVTDIIAAPAVNAGSNFELCIDAADTTMTGFTPAGGTWSGTGISNPMGVFSPSTSGAGLFTLSYTVSNASCTTTDAIIATVHDLPNVVAGVYGPICEDDTVGFNASGANNYIWNPTTELSNASVANPVFNPTGDGSFTYTVTGTDANGCVNSDQTTVVVEPVPEAAFSAADVCIGDPTVFINQSSPPTGLSYQWSFGNGQSSTDENPSVLYQASGNFNVNLVTTLGNCSATFSDTATVNPLPTASFIPTPRIATAIEPLINFEDLSVNAVEWIWQFGSPTDTSTEQHPSFAFGDTGVHVIQLVTFNEFGCTDTILDSIRITPATTLYVPSAFTPDRDRINDTFRAFGEDIFWFDFRVFDRWGKELFVTDDLLTGWDGRDMKSGNEVKAGLYTYQILYEDFRGRRFKKLGRVSLIR